MLRVSLRGISTPYTTARQGRPIDATLRHWWRELCSGTTNPARDTDAAKRVFGVVAHIDAGKTTTSERMLYYAGALSRVGNVDTGDTAMDFLPAERERGITVNSAAISFNWRDHLVYLVDSPGHLDFTYEVQRALRVMDGVVVVLDAVAGVQPQTETVWRQANEYDLPRIAFVNKMDRQGANFSRAVGSIASRFPGTCPVPVQLPIMDATTDEWHGFVDLPTMQATLRENTLASESRPTKEESREDVSISDAARWNPQIMHQARSAREHLVETVAGVDDELFEVWANGEDISGDTLVAAIRRACISRAVVPVFCGSSLKNCGVQALMDAAVALLPSPSERPALVGEHMNGELVELARGEVNCSFLAMAFKVTHDKHRGRLVYLRSFRGSLDGTKQKLVNVSNGKKEVPTALLRIMADQVEQISSVEPGDIFAAVGLRHTKTGDTVSASASRATGRKTAETDKAVRLRGVSPPPAVFSVAIEAESASAQRDLDATLEDFLVEDPSLELSVDPYSGETLLSGMGQLHLDIVVDRIRRTLPHSVHVSKPRVTYRETIQQRAERLEHYDSTIGGTSMRASLRIELEPMVDAERTASSDTMSDTSLVERFDIVLPPDIEEDEGVANSIRDGIESALRRGPVLGSPTTGVRATVLSSLDSLNASSLAALSACASQATSRALQDGDPQVLEPVMLLECSVPEETTGDIIREITHPTIRRGVVEDVVRDTDDMSVAHSADGGNRFVTIRARIPVEGMLDWANCLRSTTKGRGAFSMEFASFEPVTRSRQQSLAENDAY